MAASAGHCNWGKYEACKYCISSWPCNINKHGLIQVTQTPKMILYHSVTNTKQNDKKLARLNDEK